MDLFPFETLRAIVGGTSAIDVRGLQVADEAAAEDFLECYGFRWEDPVERAELERLRVQALDFIEECLLDPDERVPAEVAEEADVRRLLLAVSQPDRPAPWACGLLRVMHTLAHAQSDFSTHFADQIEAQVLGRFEEWIRREDAGIFLGDIPLVSFETRARKELPSIVMKLLHKPENVAAAVFDRIGVRFVTRRRLDALLVVRFLRRHNVFMFANVKPSRSKNTLVDLARLEAVMGDFTDMEALAAEVQAWPYPDAGGDPSNPFSSRAYHAIQFTARQRVRVTDTHGQTFRLFFPFEIQVFDAASLEEAQRGYASHTEYKERQRRAARQRVLGDALSLEG